jgi:hypothetical protein
MYAWNHLTNTVLLLNVPKFLPCLIVLPVYVPKIMLVPILNNSNFLMSILKLSCIYAICQTQWHSLNVCLEPFVKHTGTD